VSNGNIANWLSVSMGLILLLPIVTIAEGEREATILQSFTPQPSNPGEIGAIHGAQYILQNSPEHISCTALSIGPNGSGRVTITLYDHPTTYPNGVCKGGALVEHASFRVASGNSNYKWIGAWVMPGGSPRNKFWPNGQIAVAKTARSWPDVGRDRVSVPGDSMVYLDANGNILQAYLPDQSVLHPDINDVALPDG
jgi:hypothetical protein